MFRLTKSLSVLVVPGVIGEPNLGSRLPARAFSASKVSIVC